MKQNQLTELRSRFLQLQADFSDQAGPLEALRQAIIALEGGNFGVGACLVSRAGTIVETGRNLVFQPRFNSMAHAEMVVLNRYEAMGGTDPSLTLVTSLQPCTMCMGRIILSKIRRVSYLASGEDRDDRGCLPLSHFPPEFQRAALSLQIKQIEGADPLIEFANEIADTFGDFVGAVKAT